MDEPLGALDKQLREQMQLEIKQLHDELGVTVVYVTHDQSEAITMSDRIVVLRQGKIEQLGSSADLYDRPRTKFVADFIGQTNVIPAQRSSQDVVLDQLGLTIRPTAYPAGDHPLFLNRTEKLTARRRTGSRVPRDRAGNRIPWRHDLGERRNQVRCGHLHQPSSAPDLNPSDAIWLSFDPSDAVLVVDVPS